MTAKISSYKDVLYSREYSNDISPQTDLAKRVALAAVPFLSLHPSLRFPVSIAMGTLRVWKADHKDRVETTLTEFFNTAIFTHSLPTDIRHA